MYLDKNFSFCKSLLRSRPASKKQPLGESARRKGGGIKTVARLGATAVVALVAMAFVGGASASAQTINPEGQSYSAEQNGVGTLAVGDEEVTCTESSASGEVSEDPEPRDTASIAALSYSDCSATFGLTAEVTTDMNPEWTLIADDADSGAGDVANGRVQIPSGGSATVVIRGLFGSTLCTIVVPGGQDVDGTFDEDTQVLTFAGEGLTVDVTGSDLLCPDEEDLGSITASYDVISTPDITVD